MRLIDSDGSPLGIKPVAEALALAKTKGLDLIEIAAMATPPVCKILDYSKFLYDQEKKLRATRKRAKTGLLKEVRFTPVIGQHDLDVKIGHMEDFLKEHDKVRVTIVFRGRQMQHRDLGMKLMDRIKERLVTLAVVEQPPMPDRNRMVMTLAPKH